MEAAERCKHLVLKIIISDIRVLFKLIENKNI
jgi:hypothetical protein